jgi:CMD domain protein
MTDVIDKLAGLAPGSALSQARDNRMEARKHAQASYDSLFVAADFSGVTRQERFALAAFVAGLHGRAETADHYKTELVASGAPAALQAAVAAEIAAAQGKGPYGNYPKGPLSAENAPGPAHKAKAEALGRKLASAFEHTHMLVFHPRDAAPPSLQAMLDAGWSTTDIVVISQLVSFLSYQIRVVAGLRVLAGGK